MNEDQIDDLIEAINRVGRAIECLGNADASTPMGAIESYGALYKDIGTSQVTAIEEAGIKIAEALREGLRDIANQIHAIDR